MFGQYIKHKALVAGTRLIIGVGTSLINSFFRNIARCSDDYKVIKTKHSREPYIMTLKGSEKKKENEKPKGDRVTCALLYSPHPRAFITDEDEILQEYANLSMEECKKKQDQRQHEQDSFDHLIAAIHRFQDPFSKYKKSRPMTDEHTGEEKIDISATLKTNLERELKEAKKKRMKKINKKVAEQEKKKRREEQMASKKTTDKSVADSTKKRKLINAFDALLEGAKKQKKVLIHAVAKKIQEREATNT